ncbi:MAG: TolC family protein [Desulfobacterales bacterium]
MKKMMVVLALVLWTGCALTHPTDPYAPAEHSPAAARSPASSAGLPEEPLTLDQAVAISLANNPEIAALKWDQSAAAARRDQAFAQRLPRLGAEGGFNHHMDEQRIAPVREPETPSILTRDVASADLVLSVPLFTAGRLINEAKAADLLRQASAQQFSSSRKTLVFNISSLFHNMLAQQQVIESVKFSEQTLAAHQKRMDAMVQAEKAAEVDRMRTEVRLADVRQQLVHEKTRLAVYRRTLASLLGLSDHADMLRIQGELELPEKLDMPTFEAAFTKAQKKRDDYRAERAALEAKAMQVDAARAGHWPMVSLLGTYGGRWAAGATSGTGDESDDEGRIGVAVEMPIFDGGQISAEIREQRAELAAAQKRLHALELDIRLEIETALADIASFRKRAAALEKSITQARESLRIEQQKYELGKGMIVDVLDAQDALLDAETTYHQAAAGLRSALARLKLATGEV